MQLTYRIHFLGTNGWYDTPTGNTICILIDCRDYGLILDAGQGLYKLDSVTALDRPFYLFLSHLHMDHVYGLHVLNKFPFQRPLKIFVPEGQKTHLKRLLSPPFTIDYRDLPYEATVHELPEALDLLPCAAEVKLLKHSAPTFGLRLNLSGKTVVYCPDTGLCDNAVALARGADLLIAECAYLPGEENEGWPHLNPETAARLATLAEAKKLILVHFDAAKYSTLRMRRFALEAAQRIFPHAETAFDGQSMEI